MQVTRQRRRIAPDVRGALNFAARLSNWLTNFETIQQRDFLAPRIDHIGHLQQYGGAFSTLHAGPDTRVEGLACGCNCSLRLCCACALTTRNQHAVRGAMAFKGPAIRAFHMLAINEKVIVAAGRAKRGIE